MSAAAAAVVWLCRHGDLKAGNVLLQASTTASRAGSMQEQQTLLQVWSAVSQLPWDSFAISALFSLAVRRIPTSAQLCAVH